MKTQAKCLSCMLTQITTAMRFAGCDENQIYKHTCTVMDDIRMFNKEDTPAYNSTLALCRAYELIGNDDPYKEIKRISNEEAQTYYSYLENTVNTAEDKLFAAFQASVAGNIIDFGVSDQYDIAKELELSLKTGFARNDYAIFKKALETAKDILFLSDNSGEIVFDKLVVKELLQLGKNVTYMVKGQALLNDTLMEDAVQTGMAGLVPIVTTGAKNIGFERRVVCEEAVSRFDKTPLVIAKGMANFETLGEQPQAKGKTFCVLKAKCDLVAAETGVSLNDLVFAAL